MRMNNHKYLPIQKICVFGSIGTTNVGDFSLDSIMLWGFNGTCQVRSMASPLKWGRRPERISRCGGCGGVYFGRVSSGEPLGEEKCVIQRVLVYCAAF